MVTISEILRTVITSLEPIVIGENSYTVQFYEGILSDAKEQMNTYKKANLMPYPCVWLIRDFPELDQNNRITVTGLQLIFLIDTQNSYQAPERLDNTINPYLIPLKDNVINGLQSAGCYIENKVFTKLTHLGNQNANIQAANSKTNSKIFADYLDGLKLVINLSYQKQLNLVCYG